MNNTQMPVGTVAINSLVSHPETTRSAGWLYAGCGHEIYFEERGNRNAKTSIIHLHGGPGSSFNEKHLALYDFSRHHVIFFDQRGCGRSTPFAETANNTTQDLVADIELLREHFGFQTVGVVGGSWGSTLALFYAIAHPERVSQMMIWSVFLNRQFEIDFVNDGRLRTWFPEAWDRFIDLVPEEYRQSGNATMAYYSSMIRSDDDAVAQRYADEWTMWETTLSSINHDWDLLESETIGDPKNRSVARLETHYFLNQCFVAENHIISNIERIKHIPCDIIHGRFDMCTPPVSAFDLKQLWGQQCSLTWVNSGHSRSDPNMLPVLQEILSEKFR